jgi:mono/diheme cytochrome c family protein
VDRVETSCGCTVANLPANPWHIAPGGHGPVDVTMDLVGKPTGMVAKTITFYLSANGVTVGNRVITVKALIPPEPKIVVAPLSAAERAAAMAKAKADPQRIFTDAKCAECHVNRGVHATEQALYVADCGICHDSPNRASSVPDLHKIKAPPGAEYWKRIIYNGKPNTMMPAFSTRHGGPLTNEQVGSLVSYLSRAFAPEAAMSGGR